MTSEAPPPPPPVTPATDRPHPSPRLRGSGLRWLVAGLLALAALAPTDAQSATATPTSGPIEVGFTPPSGGATEIPPEVLPGGWRSYYVTTEQTVRCDSPDNLLTSGVDCCKRSQAGDCTWPYARGSTSPEYKWHGTSTFPLDPPPGGEFGFDHRMGYHGVFGAVPIASSQGDPYIVTANHGENKNLNRADLERYWKSRGETDANAWLWFYQNTVFNQAEARAPGYRLPSSPTNCYSGFRDGGYYECYMAYSAFVSTANVPAGASNGYGNAALNDLGPAVWPKYGYTSDDGARRASFGVKHPSIVDGGDGYLYMFYSDSGQLRYDESTGRYTGFNVDAGIRVARSPKSALGAGWATWVAGSSSWVPSLPAGVGSRYMSSAFDRPSPARSDPLFESDSVTFNVAKLRGSDRWIGVDLRSAYDEPECAPGKRWQRLMLRTSTDLVRWSAPVPLTGVHAAAYNKCGGGVGSGMSYPRLIADDGYTTKEVDASGFHIVGTDSPRVFKARVTASGL